MAVQVPIAFAATGLLAAGGYALAGWASVGACVAGAALAAMIPDARPPGPAGATPRSGRAALRAGLGEAVASVAVRAPLLAVA